MTLIHESEITGVDKLILAEKDENMFTFDQLVYLYENTVDYKHVAYLDNGTEFYEKLYIKK
jgi:Tfp pilus assembly ATPase PilU